jgi:CheY-like chemotaxis protein
MALTSLVVCADAKAVQVLSRALESHSLSAEHCGDYLEAAKRLATEHYDALLVDCSDEQAAADLIGVARASEKNQTVLAIAIADTHNNVREVFQRGANFVLYKPLSAERVANSLHAAQGMVSHERRRKPRVTAPASATISYADVESDTAHLMNLSEEGIGISSRHSVPSQCKVYFEFTLPEQVSTVRLSGEVVWQDAFGRVGLRFSRLPQTSRNALNQWLSQNLAGQLQAAPDSTPAKLPSDQSENAAEGAVDSLSGSSDRRVQARVACRLSADVYVLGNTTAQHCSLTDISNGGCYVETNESYPSGTAVDIVVRTLDMKLRVQGIVHATHPGFGMGVEFTLLNDEQREQVKQLIAAQEAAAETEVSSEG